MSILKGLQPDNRELLIDISKNMEVIKFQFREKLTKVKHARRDAIKRANWLADQGMLVSIGSSNAWGIEDENIDKIHKEDFHHN